MCRAILSAAEKENNANQSISISNEDHQITRSERVRYICVLCSYTDDVGCTEEPMTKTAHCSRNLSFFYVNKSSLNKPY